MTSVPLWPQPKVWSCFFENAQLNSTQLNSNQLASKSSWVLKAKTNCTVVTWSHQIGTQWNQNQIHYLDWGGVAMIHLPYVSFLCWCSRFFAQKAELGPDPKKPTICLDRRKNVEFCRAVQEVVQPFSGGPAKSAALQRQSFMAALFHLQESNCGFSAQVILPTVSPSHAFNLWLICGPRPPLSSSAQPGFSSRNPARSRPNASRRTGTPCSLDLWPQCLVLVCGSLIFFFFFTSHHLFPAPPTSLFSLLCPSKNSSISVKSISSLR